MKTFLEFRKEVKKLGYSVKLKTLSFGRAATFVHLETRAECTGNVFTEETLKKWKPLFDFLGDFEDEIKQIQKIERIYGLTR